jgi:hypothetical protein
MVFLTFLFYGSLLSTIPVCEIFICSGTLAKTALQEILAARNKSVF